MRSSRCRSILKIGATRDHHNQTQSLALRARDGLISRGWTKDRRGLDVCPAHPAAIAHPAGARTTAGQDSSSAHELVSVPVARPDLRAAI
jgi:hypothetical protein